MKLGQLECLGASGTHGSAALALGIAVACAASCAVDDEGYQFDAAQGGASGMASGAPSGASTGGTPNGGRGGSAGPSSSGGVSSGMGGASSGVGGSPSIAGGTDSGPPGGESAGATAGAAGAAGGTPSTPTGGASATGGAAASTGGSSGGGGAPSDDVNECAAAENPCLNGAKCEDTASGFSCDCLARYTGERCEHLKFRGLGLVTGATASSVDEISDDGSVVGGSATAANGTTVPVRLSLASGAALQSLGVPPEAAASGCMVSASNANGTWLGGMCLGLKSGGGYMWTPTDGPSLAATTVYRSLDFRDATPDARIRVGTIVVQEGDDQQPFRWTTATGFVPIEVPAGNHYASHVSANGDVIIGTFVGVVDGATAARGFRWTTSSAASYLPAPEFENANIVNGMSEDGSVMVGYGVADQVPHALRWSGSPIELEDLGSGFLMDCSADGEVMLGGNAAEEIVIWESGVPRTLLSILGDTPDLAGWTLVEPVAISDDGKVVVGNGMHDGVSEGWIAHL